MKTPRLGRDPGLPRRRDHPALQIGQHRAGGDIGKHHAGQIAAEGAQPGEAQLERCGADRLQPVMQLFQPLFGLVVEKGQGQVQVLLRHLPPDRQHRLQTANGIGKLVSDRDADKRPHGQSIDGTT